MGLFGNATEAQLDGACAFASGFLSERTVPLDVILSAEQHGHDTASRGATNALALAGCDLARQLRERILPRRVA